ncbi:MFS transporter [Micromonospora maritima]|uniref:MFS transporter n=1 Tax=Micromonospora maritima TaxID=986711 RepID=UPI001FEAC1F3|nr:MFS transporter [Micromonospora maritima]
MGRVSPFPPPGPLRTLALATLANTVGTGLWVAGGALYLTRDVGLSATSVGVGLTVAGLVGLTASVPLGGLADRWDPRALRAALQVGQAFAAAAYLLVDSLTTFLIVAVPEALLSTGNLAVRAALVAAVGGPTGRVHAFATLRAVANLGITAGTALAGIALAVDTHRAYQVLVVGNVATYLLSAALLLRVPRQRAGGGARRVTGATRRGGSLRDGRFLAVSGASALLGTHLTVLTLVVPLWTVGQAGAPPPVVSAVLLVNTLLTVLLAVRLSGGADTAAPAARKLRRAGLVVGAATEYVPPPTEPELYVNLLVTDRAYAGRGVGARLLAHAAELARDRGVGLLRVDCFRSPDRALVRFYEGCGFTATDPFTVQRPGRAPWPGQVLARRVG